VATLPDDVVQGRRVNGVFAGQRRPGSRGPCHGVRKSFITTVSCLPNGLRERWSASRGCPQVVRGMAPFRCQPGVVEIEPADMAADVKGSLDGSSWNRTRNFRSVRTMCRGRWARGASYQPDTPGHEPAAQGVDVDSTGAVSYPSRGRDRVTGDRSLLCRPGPCPDQAGRWNKEDIIFLSCNTHCILKLPAAS